MAHDVRLVPHGDPASVVPPRIVEGETDDPPGAGDADRLHRHSRIRLQFEPRQRPKLLAEPVQLVGAPLELDAGVEILGVLPDDHDVHPREP